MTANDRLMTIAAMSGVFGANMTSDHRTVRSTRISGNIVGPARKTQPRNQPCQCGSGVKAKKCCVYEEKTL